MEKFIYHLPLIIFGLLYTCIIFIITHAVNNKFGETTHTFLFIGLWFIIYSILFIISSFFKNSNTKEEDE